MYPILFHSRMMMISFGIGTAPSAALWISRTGVRGTQFSASQPGNQNEEGLTVVPELGEQLLQTIVNYIACLSVIV